MRVVVWLVSGEEKREVLLGEGDGEVTFGRGDELFQIQSKKVSRVHGKFDMNGEELGLVALGSNHILVLRRDGKKEKLSKEAKNRLVLEDGDVIKIVEGEVEMIVEIRQSGGEEKEEVEKKKKKKKKGIESDKNLKVEKQTKVERKTSFSINENRNSDLLGGTTERISGADKRRNSQNAGREVEKVKSEKSQSQKETGKDRESIKDTNEDRDDSSSVSSCGKDVFVGEMRLSTDESESKKKKKRQILLQSHDEKVCSECEGMMWRKRRKRGVSEYV
jgi:hypothetical protein